MKLIFKLHVFLLALTLIFSCGKDSKKEAKSLDEEAKAFDEKVKTSIFSESSYKSLC